MATSEFWRLAGIALVIFALCSGCGSCFYLAGLGDAAKHEPRP